MTCERWRFRGLKEKDVTIIGAGPAGVAAAVQLKREGFNPFLLEQDRVGGLLWNANLIENYPGFPQGIPGKKLADLLSEHLNQLYIKVNRLRVKHLSWEKGVFELRTDQGNSSEVRFRSKAVIVATGTIPRRISLEGEKENSGKKLFYEVKGLPATAGKRITIIGSGDVAFDYALSLVSPKRAFSQRRGREYSCKINLLLRGNTPNCLPVLSERVKSSDKIKLWTQATPQRIRRNGDEMILECRSADSRGEFTICSDYILVAIGRVPNIQYFSEALRGLYSEGDFSKTIGQEKVPGLWLAGDVVSGDYRQAGIAVGEGLSVGMRAARYLKEEDLTRSNKFK